MRDINEIVKVNKEAAIKQLKERIATARTLGDVLHIIAVEVEEWPIGRATTIDGKVVD